MWWFIGGFSFQQPEDFNLGIAGSYSENWLLSSEEERKLRIKTFILLRSYKFLHKLN